MASRKALTDEQRLRKREQSKARREERKAAGLCVYCGGKDERTTSGKIYCAKCSEKENQRQRLLKEKRKANGICTICGGQDDRTKGGAAYCTACAKKINDDQRRRRHSNQELRARQNAEKKADYQYLKKNHLCVLCGTKDAYTLAGRCYCQDCAEKQVERGRKYREENRQKFNRRANERRNALIAAGKCTSCGRPTEDGFSQCRRCLAKRRNNYAANRSPEINWPRGDNGICWQCNKEPVKPGFKLCSKCYDRQLVSLSKTYGGQGSTAPRAENHPFRVAARIEFESRKARKRRKP